MFTSNFHRLWKKPYESQGVSIALGTPGWFRGKIKYRDLAPRREMLVMEPEEYTREYQMILDELDPEKVLNELGEDAVLLCWEPAGKFCHRRLVAKWLEESLGIEVPELPSNYNPHQQSLF